MNQIITQDFTEETLLHADNNGIDRALFLEWVESENYTQELKEEDNNLVERFQDSYAGCYETLRDWAEDFLGNCGYFTKENELLQRYFDYDSFTRDCLGNDIWKIRIGPNVHVFNMYY